MVKERQYPADIADFSLRDCSVVGKYEEHNLALLDSENVAMFVMML